MKWCMSIDVCLIMLCLCLFKKYFGIPCHPLLCSFVRQGNFVILCITLGGISLYVHILIGIPFCCLGWRIGPLLICDIVWLYIDHNVWLQVLLGILPIETIHLFVEGSLKHAIHYNNFLLINNFCTYTHFCISISFLRISLR